MKKYKFADRILKIALDLKMTLNASFFRRSLLVLAVILISSWGTELRAQYEDYDYNQDYQDEESPDSSEESDSYDDYDPYGTSGGSSGANGIEIVNDGKVGKPITKKEYVRFAPPVDTITRLITYLEVVEVKDQEGYEAYADSLYIRAQRWLEAQYNKKELKEYIKENGANTKGEGYIIVMKGQFPLIMKPNEFTTKENGNLEFNMELRFKDGRYRYKINNLVHVQPPVYGQPNEIRTYMEFYAKTKRDVQGSDKILLAADAQIRDMIKNLYEQCKEPIVVDEEDW